MDVLRWGGRMTSRSKAPRLFGLRRAGAAGHWWLQRVSSIALAPLSVWCVIVLLSDDLSYRGAHALLSDPLEATMALLFVVCGLHHSWLGVTVIIDDYVHGAVIKRAVRRGLLWAHVLLTAVGVAAIVSILGGSN